MGLRAQVERASARAAASVLLLLATACTSSDAAGPGAASRAASADELLIVDCLLPPQVRSLGQRVTYLAARKAIKTTAYECGVRGGEYVAAHQASRASALSVWLPRAKEGDAEAQNYVGEIYEKGLGLAADYAAAIVWYRRAAEQGSVAAQINLGNLYEHGLGVPRSAEQAQEWYRRASGLDAIGVEFVASEAPGGDLETLREGLAQRDREAASLRAEIARLQAALESRAQKAADAFEIEQSREAVVREREHLEDLREELRREREALGAEQRRFDGERDRSRQQSAEQERLQADLVRRKHELDTRARKLQEQQRDLEDDAGALQQKVAGLEQELAEREKARPPLPLAAPSIQIIDPPVPLQRGVRVTASESPAARRVLVGRVEAPAGLLALTVNDHETTPADTGIFRSVVEVPQSGIEVVIVAVDRQGQRAERRLRLSRGPEPALAAAAPQSPSRLPDLDFGRYVALVVGNADYRNLPKLETAVNDAEAVAGLLEQQYGFEVRLLRNATRYQLLSALNELRTDLSADDNLLIFYAGHGELDRANMRGHWLPIDAEPTSTANWISNVAITDVLNAMSARHVLVIADSCYSGSLTRSSLARLEAGMTPEARRAWLKAMLGKRSRTALTSGGLQPVLDSGGGGHSIFARVLLEVLERNGEVLEAQQLYHDLSARVVWAAEGASFEQTPRYAPIQYAGHEAGEFFFVPRDPRSVQVDPDSAGQAMPLYVLEGEQAFVLHE